MHLSEIAYMDVNTISQLINDSIDFSFQIMSRTMNYIIRLSPVSEKGTHISAKVYSVAWP